MRGGGFQGVTAATNSMVRRRSIPRRNSQRLQGTAAVDLKVRRTEPAPRRGRFCRSPETKLEAPPAGFVTKVWAWLGLSCFVTN
ncbi:hypothetical protein EJB05_50861 [Eragrostis curvula]|uniref:Uncharacterized protein n=1 Tax=Eragrostis curvula TaxID=38414 RepID=A0A5J9SX19_9POAL|nr:hypothetical protein EJB05_50861 [Eragrostis curvula]